MLFNDYFLFDTETNYWTKVEKDPNSVEPLARESQSCCVVNKENIYIFGGQGVTNKGREHYYNDLHRVRLNICR